MGAELFGGRGSNIEAVILPCGTLPILSMSEYHLDSDSVKQILYSANGRKVTLCLFCTLLVSFIMDS